MLTLIRQPVTFPKSGNSKRKSSPSKPFFQNNACSLLVVIGKYKCEQNDQQKGTNKASFVYIKPDPADAWSAINH